jgi:hypothetical protein
MKITFSSYSGKFYWHVFYVGDTVGAITRSKTSNWSFTTNGYESFHRLSVQTQEAIKSAAQEKTNLLNITQRMTS